MAHTPKKLVTLATTNPGKVISLQRAIEKYGIIVAHAEIELPEPQTHDLEHIAQFKAAHAYKILQKPVISQDSGFNLDAWPGFPGPFVKHAIQTLGNPGLLHLCKGLVRTCEFKECIAFVDGEDTTWFTSSIPGTLAQEVRGDLPKDAWSPLWQVFIPQGWGRTIAEMTPAQRERWRAERGNTCATQFAEWYSS